MDYDFTKRYFTFCSPHKRSADYKYIFIQALSDNLPDSNVGEHPRGVRRQRARQVVARRGRRRHAAEGVGPG